MQIPPEKRKLIKEYCERKLFFDSFVEQLIVCDPLDRCNDQDRYPAMNGDCVLTIAELKKKILKM